MFKKYWIGTLLGSVLAGGYAQANQSSYSPFIENRSNSAADSSVIPASWIGGSCDCANDSSCNSGSCCDWGTGCDSGSNCDGMGCGSGLLGFGMFPGLTGLVKKSEHCYDDFISPMTNPFYFEDPRQLTEARAVFVNHKLPVVPTVGSGRAQVYALQVRVRLTERLSLIAVKDGFLVSQSPVMDDGWFDISAGLKYSIYRDACSGTLLSGGVRVEVPTGMARTLQGNGRGVMDIFLSGGQRIGNSAHILSSSGLILPFNDQLENRMFYWSNHLDKRVLDSSFYAFTELNWYNYTRSGNAFPLPLAGGDAFNLGSVGVAGQNIVTNAYGLKYKPNGNLEAGVAWEFPLTQTRGVLDNRLTADLILRY